MGQLCHSPRKGWAVASRGMGSGGFSSFPGSIWLAEAPLHAGAFGLHGRELCMGDALLAQHASCNDAGKRRSEILGRFSTTGGAKSHYPGKGKDLHCMAASQQLQHRTL